MNLQEHLLTCLGEEGCEVGQITSKALRFGINDVNVLKPDGPSNEQRLIDELNDLVAVADLCVAYGILPKDWQNKDKQKAKMRKVEKFMAYAVSKGTLIDFG